MGCYVQKRRQTFIKSSNTDYELEISLALLATANLNILIKEKKPVAYISTEQRIAKDLQVTIKEYILN